MPDVLGQCILGALAGAAAELAESAIVTVEDGGVRVRQLPTDAD